MSYKIPKTELCDEQVIKKSRFITHIAPAVNKAEAKLYIQNIKALYPDARHHCWAYIAGHPTATTDIGFSDGGEPSGTAGKPILNVLQHRGIGEIVLVVVRYFGGIKLGAGGLVRAYSSSASLAMDKLKTITLVETKVFKIRFDYNLETNIKRLLESQNINIQKADYSARVSLTIDVPTTNIENLNRQLVNISSGQLSLI
ncbi:YigZ family protein [Ghiorsea bivora]|uniref:YigZ family protein n=1 Tax=Ghiorsea bivora TaxID=1485545 RepID=UPI000690E7C7|nr:YigZ family protein [Ghiorsea bivora]